MKLITVERIAWFSGMLIILALTSSAQLSQETPIETDPDNCTGRMINALRQASRATNYSDAQLFLAQAEAYSRLSQMVGTCE